jgi:hypothetical protein
MIAGACLVSLPLNLLTQARASETTVWELVRPLSSWFVRFVLLICGVGVLARTWTPQTFVLLGLTAIVIALVYAAVMFPLALRAPLGLYVRPRLFPLRTRVFRVLRLSGSA